MQFYYVFQKASRWHMINPSFVMSKLISSKGGKEKSNNGNNRNSNKFDSTIQTEHEAACNLYDSI
jgi:hypothetical protein